MFNKIIAQLISKYSIPVAKSIFEAFKRTTSKYNKAGGESNHFI